MNLKVKMSPSVSENPFYGKSKLKELLNFGKNITSEYQMFLLLDRAWEECKKF